MSAEHPLASPLSFWFTRYDGGGGGGGSGARGGDDGGNAHSFGDELTEVCRVETVEQFWEAYSFITRPGTRAAVCVSE